MAASSRCPPLAAGSSRSPRAAWAWELGQWAGEWAASYCGQCNPGPPPAASQCSLGLQTARSPEGWPHRWEKWQGLSHFCLLPCSGRGGVHAQSSPMSGPLGGRCCLCRGRSVGGRERTGEAAWRQGGFLQFRGKRCKERWGTRDHHILPRTRTSRLCAQGLRMAGGRHSFSNFGSPLRAPPPQPLVALLHLVVSALGTLAVKQNCQFEGLDFRLASVKSLVRSEANHCAEIVM